MNEVSETKRPYNTKSMEADKKEITSINIQPCENGCNVSLECRVKEEGKEYETYMSHRLNMSKAVWDGIVNAAMEKLSAEDKPKTTFDAKNFK